MTTTTEAMDLEISSRIRVFRCPWLLPTHKEIHRNNIDDVISHLQIYGGAPGIILDISGGHSLVEYTPILRSPVIVFGGHHRQPGYKRIHLKAPPPFEVLLEAAHATKSVLDVNVHSVVHLHLKEATPTTSLFLLAALMVSPFQGDEASSVNKALKYLPYRTV